MTFDKNKMTENNNEISDEQLKNVDGGVFFPDYMNTTYSDLREKNQSSGAAASNGNGGWEGSGGSGSSW